MEISRAITFRANMNQLNQVSPSWGVEAALGKPPLLPQKRSFPVSIVIRELYRKARPVPLVSGSTCSLPV